MVWAGVHTMTGGVEPQYAGSASGLLETTQQLGGGIGLAVRVSVKATGAVPGAFVPGLHAAFLTTAAFALAATIASVVALRNKTSESA